MQFASIYISIKNTVIKYSKGILRIEQQPNKFFYDSHITFISIFNSKRSNVGERSFELIEMLVTYEKIASDFLSYTAL